jgi:hypothetical protein
MRVKSEVETLEIKKKTFEAEKKRVENGFFLKNVDLRNREQKLKKDLEVLAKAQREQEERLLKIEDRIRVAERLEKGREKK